MTHHNWLYDKAPTETSPAPLILLPEWAVELPSPADDEPDEPELAIIDQPIELEEIFCVIDYRDANGRETRRRITMRSVAPGPNAPILQAVCHERRAIRHFRCDRIRWIYDIDGVVEDTETFFRETLMIDLAHSQKQVAKTANKVAEFREYLRPALSILILAAKSDGDFHPEEMDVICQYIEAEAASEAAASFDIGLCDLDAMQRVVRSMRPHRSSLEKHIQGVLQFDEQRYERFKKYLTRLVAADRKLAPEEEEFLAELDWAHTDAL